MVVREMSIFLKNKKLFKNVTFVKKQKWTRSVTAHGRERARPGAGRLGCVRQNFKRTGP